MTISKKEYIDVNKHERLSNFIHKTQSKGAELLLSLHYFTVMSSIMSIIHTVEQYSLFLSISSMSVAQLQAYS